MSGRRSPPTQRTGNLLGANSITMVMEMDLTVVINYMYSNCTIFSYAVTKFSFVYKILTSNQFHHIMVKISKINSQPKPPTIQFHQVIFRISAVSVVNPVLFLEYQLFQ